MGLEGQQCADGHIARNGQVQTFGSKLAFPHFGNQFITDLGEFFYLFILQVKTHKKKIAEISWLFEVKPIRMVIGFLGAWGPPGLLVPLRNDLQTNHLSTSQL